MEPVEPNQRDWPALSGVFISLLLHGLLFFALLSIAPELLDAPPDDFKITVDFVPPRLMRAATTPRVGSALQDAAEAALPEAEPAPSEMPATPSEDVPPPPERLIRPSRLLSSETLERKGNEGARRDLAGVSQDERVEQLCALEALEQIHVWNDEYAPERMVSYTFEEVRYEGNRLIADGAAFWSHDEWHHLKFECALSADLAKIIEFAFLVGAIVPRKDWEQYNLTQYK